MSGDPKQATSATMAIGYITTGSLMAVWTGVYYFYHRQVNGVDAPSMWTTGFFLTGIILVIIGFLVGQIGRSARQAEVMAAPTQIITPSVAQAPVSTLPPTATPVVNVPIAARR